MGFRLRYKEHDFELTEGQFVIGRSAECQLSLDDPLVSRRHSLLTVSPDAVTVEDLGSRNGVLVNDEKVAGVRTLAHSDKITIGGQDLLLLRTREVVTATAARNPAPTQRADAFALLGDLAEKAFALGRGEEAERILATRLDNVLRDAELGRTPTSESAEQAARYAVRLAGVTQKAKWVSYIFQLYGLLRRPCPASVVDELYEVLRKVRAVDMAPVRGYLEVMRAVDDLGPAERFLLRRIEGLERVAAAR